jgi:ribonuclease R
MFQRRLRAMEREAQLMRNRKGAYILPERASLIAGRIEGHPDGYGFLIPDDGSDDLFLEAKQMSKVLHRDRALVRVVGIDRKGRREGAIVEVLERANSSVVGRVLLEHGITVVVPENRRINQDILVAPDKKSPGKAGQVVTSRSSSSRTAIRSRSGASSKCSATTPIRAWKSKSRCASTICPSSFRKAVR